MYEIYEEAIFKNQAFEENNLSYSETDEISNFELLQNIYITNCIMTVLLFVMLLYMIVRGLFRYD